MSLEERITVHYDMAGIVWMLLSYRYASLRFRRLLSTVRESTARYRMALDRLNCLPQCLSCRQLIEHGFMKERHWKSALFMAAATSLPLLYRTASHQDIVKAVCTKTSIGTSAKLLDNLNDEAHSYGEAAASLSEYESALGMGAYAAAGKSLLAMAEQSAYELATWAYKHVSLLCSQVFSEDVTLLVSGQAASLAHRKGEYPSMELYLRSICERSIGNVWLDVDLALAGEGSPQLKKGNDCIFKSYLIYDDVQDIARDLRNNSVNAAVILGLERGILSEPEAGENPKTIENLKKAGIFQDLLYLGDLTFLKGLEIIASCDENPLDKEGFMASLGLIRMFNIRRTLTKEKTPHMVTSFFAGRTKLEKVRTAAPEYIQELVKYI
jgi:hypothetical protein